MDNQLKKLLKASLDRMLKTKEGMELHNSMQTSLELQLEKKRHDKVRELMKTYAPDFKPSFVASVMAKIQAERESKIVQGFTIAFNRIALPLLAAASILLLFTLFNEGGVSFESIIGIENLEPQYLSEFLLFNY